MFHVMLIHIGRVKEDYYAYVRMYVCKYFDTALRSLSAQRSSEHSLIPFLPQG